MNYSSVVLDEKKVSELIPRHIWKDNLSYDNLYFAAWDDDIHVLFVIDKENGKDGHCIRYMYYDDIADEHTIGNLLTYIEDTYRSEGDTHLYVELCDESDKLNRVLSSFENYDYDLISTQDKYLIYELAKMKKSTFFEKTSQAKAILDKVFFYNQLEKEQLLENKATMTPRQVLNASHYWLCTAMIV